MMDILQRGNDAEAIYVRIGLVVKVHKMQVICTRWSKMQEPEIMLGNAKPMMSTAGLDV